MVHPAIEATYRAIKELKIQGAHNVAERAVSAIYTLLLDYKGKSKAELVKEIKEAVRLLFHSRPTEPELRAAMAYVLRELKKNMDLEGEVFREAMILSLENFVQKFEDIERSISIYGSEVIEDGFTIITHCHSSTLMNIFREAAKDKDFRVIVTETRPKLQGKRTAKELLEMGVRVTYVVDSASYYFMKEADMYMTGADVITSDGKVINKIGTALMALAASHFGVPYYVAASSYKFDPVTVLGIREPIEERDPSEVIDPSELPGAEIKNPAFDATPSKFVSAIVSELGVLTLDTFIMKVMEKREVDKELEEVLKITY